MATDNWIGNNGDWANVSDWSNGAVPAVEDDAVIDSLLTQGAQVQLTSDATAGTLTLLDGASLTIATGGDLTLTAGALNVDSYSTLTVDGGTLFVGGTYVYSEIDGALIADHGASVEFASYLSFSTLTIAHGSTLTLDSAASSMTVNFGATINNAPNVLVLGDPAQFIGSINGFGPNDAVDLLGVSGAYLTQEADARGTTILVWEGDTVVATLGFSGTFYENNFELTDDGHGGETVSLAYFINHAPTLTITQPTVTLIESGLSGAGVAQATASASASDTDNGDSVTFNTTGFSLVSGTLWSETGTYGTLTLDTSDGAMTYTLDNANAHTQALGNGDVATDSFTIAVTDNYGSTTNKTVTFSIEGSNDAPVIASQGDLLAAANTPVNLGLSFTDAEAGAQTYTVTLSDQHGGLFIGPDNYVSFEGNGTNHLIITGSYGEVEQALASVSFSGVANDTVSVVVADSQGGQASSSFSVSVADQPPVITVGAAPADLVEAGADGPGTPTSTTTLTISDLDAGDTASFVTTGFTHVSGTVWTEQGGYGAITLDTATGSLTYTLDNDNSFLTPLGDGGIAEDSFTIEAQDNFGAIASTTLNFFIHGSNDAPVITAPNHVDIGLGFPGFIDMSFTDAESTSQTYTATLSVGIDSIGVASDPANGAQITNNGSHLTITGTYAQVEQALHDTYVYAAFPNDDTLTLTLTDSQGASTTSSIAVTAAPVNPTISATAPSNALVEAAGSNPGSDTATVHLTFTADEVSYGGHPPPGYPIIPNSDVSPYGHIAISTDTNSGTALVTYTLDNTSFYVQALGNGDSITDTFTLTLFDSDGGATTTTVSFVIEGTNDAPTLTLPATALTTTAGSPLGLTGLSVSDPEFLSQTYTVRLSDAAGLFHTTVADGSVVTGNGTNSLTITGTFDSILSDLGAVSFTGSTSDTVTFEVTDSQGGDAAQQFAVTVTPATTQWAAPVLSYIAPTTTLVVPGTGETAVTSAAATLAIAPATSDDTVSYSLSGFTHLSGTLYQEQGTYGTLTLDTSDGALTYTLDPSLPATHALAASAVVTDSFTLTASDAHGLSSSQAVSFTIDGSHDAPIVHNLHLYTVSGSSFTLSSSYVLEGDSDPLGYSLSITAVDGPRHGTVTLDDHGDVVYSAYQAYLGTDSFQVTVSNGHGGTTLETVSVTMTNQLGEEASIPAYVYGGNYATGQTFDVSGDDIGHQLYGSSGNDIIYGGNGKDSLNGGAGHDTIYGGAGNDAITGGPGADILWGGAGANSFVFRVGDIASPAGASGYDQIMDFSGAGDGYHAGEDIIQFYGFSSAAKLTFDATATAAAASVDPTAHYYTLIDGGYQGEIVVHYAGNAVLTAGDYGFYP